MKKAFTIIELMVSMSILGILIGIAIPMYSDYTKRTKISEIPFILKTIVQEQNVRINDPNFGSYASDISSIEWKTSSGTTLGKFYEYGTSGVEDCDPGTYSDPLPIGLAEAWAIDNNEVPVNWVSSCMDSSNSMYNNSL